jgi:hypothetical protein
LIFPNSAGAKSLLPRVTEKTREMTAREFDTREAVASHNGNHRAS